MSPASTLTPVLSVIRLRLCVAVVVALAIATAGSGSIQGAASPVATP